MARTRREIVPALRHFALCGIALMFEFDVREAVVAAATELPNAYRLTPAPPLRCP